MKRLQPQVRYKLVVPKIDGKIICTSFPLKITMTAHQLEKQRDVLHLKLMII